MKNSNKPIKDFSQLAYLIKTGSTPDEPKVKHTGNYTLKYGNSILVYNEPYSHCVNALKQFKMQGRDYPNKEKFKIVEQY